MLCGRPDKVAEAVRDLAAEAGPGLTFVARLYYPGMDREVIRRSTGLFAEAVVPAARS
jgi:alkanesulfonate monooxygenase SsuD/methylene tetrahydromethanopterin reductase-like flavin-dependent oxidoreductase (luciferase family)